MRDGKDRGWQLRMQAFHQLVSRGDASISPLLKALANGKEHQRILAAQALGFLGKDVPSEPLLHALKTDASAAVRLYAVDSLGMLGHGERLSSQLKRIQGSEKNRDVRRHIAYAVDRKDQGIEAEIVDELIKWDPNSLDQAAVGQPAPDFELTDLSGKKLKLSEFRGKKAVVLVFIYGDT